MIKKYNPALAALLTVCSLSATSVFAQNFNNIEWTVDRSNTPLQDRDGSGSTPSISNATNNQNEIYTFEISTTSTSSGLQRQEFQFERREDFHRFEGEFKIDSDQPNFDRVSLAQTHDDQTGSEGVFSIYQVRRDGNDYVFGVQGDTREANNGYSTFDTVEIELDRWYRLETRTYSANRNDSFEIARLYEGNTLIWTETIEGGGEGEQYKKVGAYRLTNGTGRVIVDWTDLTFYTGEENSGAGTEGNSEVVHMIKRNATGFAIDGNNGAANRQNVYIWDEDEDNINQQWVEINRGGGYYSYQKNGTNHCIDGNNGGSNGQEIYLYRCSENNQNQHWQKITTSSNTYRLQKRNSPSYSIDGGNNGEDGQLLTLRRSDDDNQNQQWLISPQ